MTPTSTQKFPGAKFVSIAHGGGQWTVSGIDKLGHRYSHQGYGELSAEYRAELKGIPLFRFDLATVETCLAAIRGPVPTPDKAADHFRSHGVPVETI